MKSDLINIVGKAVAEKDYHHFKGVKPYSLFVEPWINMIELELNFGRCVVFTGARVVKQ